MDRGGVLAGEFQERDHVIADVNEAKDVLALRVWAGAVVEGERELAGVAQPLPAAEIEPSAALP